MAKKTKKGYGTRHPISSALGATRGWLVVATPMQKPYGARNHTLVTESARAHSCSYFFSEVR